MQRVSQTSTYSAMSSRYERYIKKLIITATVITMTPPPPNLLSVTAVGVTRVKSSYGCPCNFWSCGIQWPWTHEVTTLRYHGEEPQCPSHKRCYWGITGKDHELQKEPDLPQEQSSNLRVRARTNTWTRAGTATPAACSTPTTNVYMLYIKTADYL